MLACLEIGNECSRVDYPISIERDQEIIVFFEKGVGLFFGTVIRDRRYLAGVVAR